VSDGHETCGYIIPHDGAFFSFDIDGTLLGEFKTQREATRAIPKRANKWANDMKQSRKRYLERWPKKTPKTIRAFLQRRVKLKPPVKPKRELIIK
jgi:hypothetical protein